MSMNAQNETNEMNDEQDIKRWTAALVLESLRGQTTVADAARTHGLKTSDIRRLKLSASCQQNPVANMHPHAPV